MEDLPPNLPEHLAAGIHAGWLNVHSKKLEGADTDLCLQEAYDVCAKALLDRGHELDEVVLRDVIPSWVIHFAGVKGWFGDPPVDGWYEDLMKCLGSRIVLWQGRALFVREFADRVRGELLKIHAKKLERADRDLCLREAYDAIATAVMDFGLELNDFALRETSQAGFFLATAKNGCPIFHQTSGAKT